VEARFVSIYESTGTLIHTDERDLGSVAGEKKLRNFQKLKHAQLIKQGWQEVVCVMLHKSTVHF